MFEVLVFVFENYWRGDACPELAHLERKLNTVGFDAEEIQDALVWLKELNLAASGLQQPVANRDEASCAATAKYQFFNQSANTMRVYSVLEQACLSVESLGFMTFLDCAGILTPHMREIVIDRALAATSADPVPLDDLKIIVLMVFWSLGKEPDALVLDELCESSVERIAH